MSIFVEQIMCKKFQIFLAALLLVGTFGCGAKELLGLGGKDRTLYSGPQYSPTSQVAIAFHPTQVPKSCKVFAEVLAQLPPKLTGKDIESAILTEAGKRGANRVLIGQSRQGDDKGTRFLYYGPDKEYLCSEQCGDWKFGYDLWEKQGEWVNIGYKEWGRAEVRYETPLVMQLVLLQCR
jgi:hypothetical protein